MVEAFYGDDSRLQHNTAIAHTAAEHARAALRVATPLETPLVPASNQYNPEEDESLFKWLGIVEPPPPVLPGDGDGSGGDGAAGEEEEEWTLPCADNKIEETPEVLPAPPSLWTPWPRGPVPQRRPHPDPATRVVSAVEAFGTVPMRAEVARWVAGSVARQDQLRKLMVSLVICQQAALVVLFFSIHPRRCSRRLPPSLHVHPTTFVVSLVIPCLLFCVSACCSVCRCRYIRVSSPCGRLSL